MLCYVSYWLKSYATTHISRSALVRANHVLEGNAHIQLLDAEHQRTKSEEHRCYVGCLSGLELIQQLSSYTCSLYDASRTRSDVTSGILLKSICGSTYAVFLGQVQRTKLFYDSMSF